MGSGNDRNIKCHCGSGNKYKKCCLKKDEKRQALKKRVPKTTRRDLISGPYKKCPSTKCLGKDSFGVFMTIEGSGSYSRECFVCGYSENYKLPDIHKKILYLDQFVISNLVKLLDKSHISHNKIKAEPFWENLFIKLERAIKSQAIICPDSFYHRDESMVGDMNFKLMKRLYEHFSSGKTLYPSAVIEEKQITLHFGNWLEGKKTVFDFNPENIAFGENLHTWSVGLRISVGGNPYPGQIENVQKVNLATKEQLRDIWTRWASEKHINFVSRVKEETLALGKGLMEVAKRFNQKREEAMKRIIAGDSTDTDYEDFMPTIANEIFSEMYRTARAKGIVETEIPVKIVQYFNDFESIIEIPQLKISSVMFAGLAHLAKSGKKNAPKSTADVQFISSYLPYCDALFVDNESALILKQFPKNTPEKFTLKEFSPKIFSLNNKEAFLEYLDELTNAVPKNQIDILKDISGEKYAEPYWTIIEQEKKNLSKSDSE